MSVEIGMNTYFWYAILIGVETPEYITSKKVLDLMVHLPRTYHQPTKER